jgi:hypothetical protein
MIAICDVRVGELLVPLSCGRVVVVEHGSRLLVGRVTAVEKVGTVEALWPNGAAYVRCDDGEVVACGVAVKPKLAVTAPRAIHRIAIQDLVVDEVGKAIQPVRAAQPLGEQSQPRDTLLVIEQRSLGRRGSREVRALHVLVSVPRHKRSAGAIVYAAGAS